MADIDTKGGGFGSIPGDLFTELITYFGGTGSLSSATLEGLRHDILVQLARTEHAAANATKSPYVVDVVYKCVSMRADFLDAKNASLLELARKQAMDNIMTTLQALAGLWV